MTKENLTKGKLRASIFAGVFGLVCIIMTMFIGYLLTIATIITTTMGIATIIVAILTMWMVYVGTYILLLVLSDLDSALEVYQDEK